MSLKNSAVETYKVKIVGQKKCGSRKTLVKNKTWSDTILDLNFFKFDWSEKKIESKKFCS